MRSLTRTLHDSIHDSHSVKPDNSLLWIIAGLCGGIVLLLMGIVALVPRY
jgi:hypothetical protein